MEKSRAIELLKLAVPIKALTQQEYADFVEAVNMGMDALEQPTSPDTIDRKAALDALRKCQTYLYDARDPELKIELSSAEAAINNLSTIQPEKAQLSRESATSDLISRQAAIDGKISIQRANGVEIYSDEAVPVEYLKNLPTAQPEPHEGQWIWVVGDLECSKCHTRYPDLYPDYDNSVACPHCGAKMKGEANE